MSTPPSPATPADVLIEQLSALPDEPARQEFLHAHPELQTASLLSSLTHSILRQVRISVPNALRLADAATTIAQALGTPAALAEAARSKANALYAAGQNAAAVELHSRAVELFEQAGDREELGRALTASMQPLLLLGHYDRALAAGERARQIFREQGNLWRLARVEINIGNIYHRQDRFAEALAAYQRAYDELLKHGDAEGIAGSLSNLAICHMSLNNFADALSCYQAARAICDQHRMPLLVVQADYNIAYLYFLRGEYGRAIEMLRAARVTARQLGDAYHGALCNLDLSELYLELNLNSEAAELAQEAHTGFNALGMGYESAKALAFSAIASSQLGQVFEGLKRFAEAKESFIREKNQVWPSLIDLYQALILFNEGRLFEARRLASSAADFFRASTLRGKAMVAELLLARILLRMGDSAGAAAQCQTALREVGGLQTPILTYQAEFLMGQVQDAGGHPDEAYASYKRARQALELLRGNLRGEELKIAFFKNKLEVYENLIAACLRRPATPEVLEEAFAYVEQAKSRSLMDLLLQPIRRQVDSDAEAGQSELVRTIRNLREELNWYYNLIEHEQLRPEERSPERVERLERQVRARESDLLRVLQEASLAEAGQAGVPLPTHLPLEQIRQALPPHATLVEYFTVQDRYVACVVGHDGISIAPVTLVSRVHSLLRLLQFQMSKFRLDAQYINNFRDSMLAATQAHLASLYQELIAPIEGALNSSHLVVVPHGLLHYVPFHSLFDGERYLVDRFTVSYAPSASIYTLCQTRKPAGAGRALVMGVADAQAPSIRDEVEALRGILTDAQVFTGNDASEDALRRHGPESRIVHIATHGYFRQDNPMFSSIRLAGSHLSLYDLYQMKLPAELVVLSGCATGLNVVTAGDELMGLVRGLLQAGAHSLVLTLWDVHDASTAEFMVAFYRRIQAGAGKAEALQGAMLELRQTHAHPYHWSPFVLVGQI